MKSNSFRNKPCPICNVNIVKNFNAKRYAECYHKTLLGEGHPSWKGNCNYCNCGKRIENHSKECLNCFHERTKKNMPECLVCQKELYRKETKYCQNCYRGNVTGRWNNDLSVEDRENIRSKNPAYRIWQISILKLYDFKCVQCGDSRGGNLNAHHIENYSSNKEKRLDINNGVCLCKSCHIKFHKLFGFKNNNREQLEVFLI